MRAMLPLLSTLRRTLWTPALLPVACVAAGLAWLGHRLAEVQLGGGEGFVDEVRTGSLLLAGALVLSMSETLSVRREARDGLLALRAAKGGGFALTQRWLGLALGMLPTVALAAAFGGGVPAHPLPLALDLLVLAAGGLLLGSVLEGGLLIPALWLLLVVGQLRPWLAPSGAGWLLPAFGHLQGVEGALHAGLWCAGALLIADWRLSAVAGRA
jgi:hypothetical protein